MADRDIGSLVAAMTLDEKLRLVRGRSDPDGRATGYLPGVERLDVPALRLVDGPLGVRDGDSTAFPATISLGATWDPALAERVGSALGMEARSKGHDVLLAPGVNLIRVPTCGRNFEYLSEDPRVSARLGAAYVRGLDRRGVGAVVKHFVANNQESERDRVDAVVSERALRELYLPSFRAAVAAGTAAVMAAYNRVNGRYMSEHAGLLDGVLRDEWEFEGPVVSDWWGTHDAVAAAEGGLDLEMPGVSPLARHATRSHFVRLVAQVDLSGRLGVDPPLYWRPIDRWVAEDGQPDPYPSSYFGDDLRDAVVSGTVPEGTVDRMVHHVLTLYDRLGLLGGNREDAGSVDVQAHHDLARKVATRGTVILKNDGLLPLSGDESLAVIGANADRPKTGGGGSSEVTATRTVSPVDGLRDRAPSVHFERGVPPVAEPSALDVPGRNWLRRRLSPGDRDAAVSAAARADVAVVVVQDAATESEDRESLRLPGGQDRLVRAVTSVNPQTVVVCRSSGPIQMPWVDEVGAVLVTWYPGQADGEALANVCYGTDPGGRLPVTFGHDFADYPVADDRRYPGVDQRVHYDEGVFVGYRGFEHRNVDPLFAFGHGRSYAAFAYEDLTVTWAGETPRVDLTVENIGDRHGRDVVQVYVSPPDGPVERPPKELAAFRPVSLAVGEREQVSLTLPRRSLARYDADNGWTVDAGTYEIVVGRSSVDQRLQTRMTIE